MILLDKVTGKILANRKYKFIGALYNDTEVEVYHDYQKDPKGYKCFGEWYYIENLKSGLLVLQTPTESFRFIL